MPNSWEIDPESTMWYLFDLSSWLDEGVTIDSYVLTVSPETMDILDHSLNSDATGVRFRPIHPVVGVDYTVDCTFTLSTGEVDSRSMFFVGVDR